MPLVCAGGDGHEALLGNADPAAQPAHHLRHFVYHDLSYGQRTMATKAISLRLEEDALRALARLEASGLSRSEAIRRAVIDRARALRRERAVRAEVSALEADEDDRREMLEVAALMESLRAPR